MNLLRKIIGFLVSKIMVIPALLFLAIYVLVIDVDKVHKEFDDEDKDPEDDLGPNNP